MRETLTERRRVEEEGLRVVNSFSRGEHSPGEYPGDLTVPTEEAPANSVPAAAVIRGVRTLFGITGRKERVGGQISGV